MPAKSVEQTFAYLDENCRAAVFDELTIANETPSDVDWHEVDISGQISPRIKAPNPVLTSPMTTITGAEMAIAAPKNGGAGVINAACTPEEQLAMVRRVKFHLNGFIDKPIVTRPNQTVRGLEERLDNKGHSFRTIPVVDADNRFLGLITNTVLGFYREQEGDKTIGEVMIPAEKVVTGPSAWQAQEKRQDAYSHMKQNVAKALPLVTRGGRLKGMYLQDDIQRVLFDNPAGYNLDPSGRLITAMAVSTWAQDAVERVQLSGKYLDLVVIDTSHGESIYTFNALKALREACKLVKNLREEYDVIDLMVGNVSDPEPALALAAAGAHVIRVGRGPSGICISRQALGGGTPQATAIYEIRKALDEHGFEDVDVCADGGIRGPGDYVKARLLGADSIMVGGYVAGTNEVATELKYDENGNPYYEYNGMASEKELRASWAARLRYDSSFKAPSLEDDDVFVEGIEKKVPPRGPVDKRFRDLSRGLKIEMSNGGFRNVDELQRGGRVWTVGTGGMVEAGVHS